MKQKLVLGALATFIALAVLGCPSPTSPKPDPIIGTWTAVSFSNGTLTESASAAGATLTLAVLANNTWTATQTVSGDPTTYLASGTWAKIGSSYTLTETAVSPTTTTTAGQAPNTFTATLSSDGNTLTFAVGSGTTATMAKN